MGAWGTGVFSDDTACDVRDSYREHIGNGLSGMEATARVLAEFAGSLKDPNESAVVWLALAATQWKVGRLEPETLKEALQAIDSGIDLARWGADTSDGKKRRLVLEKLRAQIESPQPAQKKAARQYKETCNWEPGTLIAYRLASGNRAIFRVAYLRTDKGGTSPVCELLDWTGKELPSKEQLGEACLMRNKQGLNHSVGKMILFRPTKASEARIEVLDFQLAPAPGRGGAAAVFWKGMDAWLKRWFDLE